MNALPVGRRVAAVHRLGPVEASVALRDKIGMEVRDIALRVREDRVVRRVGMQLHHLAELLDVDRLGPGVRLGQRLDRLLHQPDTDPFAVGFTYHRTMLGAVNGELLFRMPAEVLYGTVMMEATTGRCSVPYL